MNDLFKFVKLIFKILLTSIMTVVYPIMFIMIIAIEKDANSFKKALHITNDFYKDEFANLWT